MGVEIDLGVGRDVEEVGRSGACKTGVSGPGLEEQVGLDLVAGRGWEG